MLVSKAAGEVASSCRPALIIVKMSCIAATATNLGIRFVAVKFLSTSIFDLNNSQKTITQPIIQIGDLLCTPE